MTEKDILDDDDWFYKMQIFSIMCDTCEHFNWKEHEDSKEFSVRVCKAFPEGIPVEIWMKEFDHHYPYPGDNGIKYKKREKII